MYTKFFGFSVKPFELIPDSKFLYLSSELREIFATLEYGIVQRRGFMLLVGEPGTGKTTLLNSLIDKLYTDADFAYIFNPDLDFNDLLHSVLIEFGLASADEDLSKTRALQRLKIFMNEQFEKSKIPVIVVDEAQCLDIKILEKLRLLSNVTTRKHQLLQIIISGQPELEDTLSHKKLTQLAQRIGLRCRTKPLNEKDAYEYIDHRLDVADYNGSQLFANKAKQLIWKYSQGIPRIINIICDNSLLFGYSTNQKRIDSFIVKEVIDELNKVPLDNLDYPQDKSQETIKEVSQTPSNKSDEIPEDSPGLPEKKEKDSSNIIDDLRRKLSRNQESESVEKKESRFRATWIALSAGVVIILIILILFLFFGKLEEFKNEFSSKLEAVKNNFESQLDGTKNSTDEITSDDKITIKSSLPVSSPEVEDEREQNLVVVKKSDTLYKIILRVYGKYEPEFLEAILEINPEIKNPDFIFENQVIKLPENVDLN